MASFGDSLRRERELRQITLREISEATKINHRYLEALERNDFRHLPGGVFNKGFVRAYAQYVGIDPDRMVLSYLEEERRQAGPAGAVQEAPKETKTRAFSVRRTGRGKTRRLAWWSTAALGIAAIVLAVAFGWIPWPWIPSTAETTPPPPVAAGAEPTEPAPSGFLFRLSRPTRGMLRCDDGRAWDLASVEVGAEVPVGCPGGIVVDVDDAGALLVEGGGVPSGPLGPDGAEVRGFRLVGRVEGEEAP
jgi:transcriptional regulator with XRE-family HTH domain